MSVAPLPYRRPGGKSPVLTDGDVLFLLGDHPAAIRVLLAVKLLAAGRLWIEVTNDELARKLGVCERTVRRAKQRIRAAGVPVHERTNRVGQSMASRWILDRRQVAGLRWSDVSPQGDTCVRPYIDENLSEEEVRSSPPPPSRPRGQPKPPADGDESETPPPATRFEAVPTPDDDPPSALAWPVAELRQWLAERFELGSEEGRADAAAALPEAVRWLNRRMRERGETSIVPDIAGHWLAQTLQVGVVYRSDR